jgi:hypothetical protein
MNSNTKHTPHTFIISFLCVLFLQTLPCQRTASVSSGKFSPLFVFVVLTVFIFPLVILCFPSKCSSCAFALPSFPFSSYPSLLSFPLPSLSWLLQAAAFCSCSLSSYRRRLLQGAVGNSCCEQLLGRSCAIRSSSLAARNAAASTLLCAQGRLLARSLHIIFGLGPSPKAQKKKKKKGLNKPKPKSNLIKAHF